SATAPRGGGGREMGEKVWRSIRRGSGVPNFVDGGSIRGVGAKHCRFFVRTKRKGTMFGALGLDFSQEATKFGTLGLVARLSGRKFGALASRRAQSEKVWRFESGRDGGPEVVARGRARRRAGAAPGGAGRHAGPGDQAAAALAPPGRAPQEPLGRGKRR